MEKPREQKAKKHGQTPMDAALKYLTHRARTVREVERHLDGCHFGEYEIQQVIDRLLELNYLNDGRYAEEFVRSRLATKPVSRRRLREQLLSHEVPADIAESAIAGVPEETEQANAAAVAKKFARRFGNPDAEETRERIMQRLFSRGYSCEDARRAVEMLDGEEP